MPVRRGRAGDGGGEGGENAAGIEKGKWKVENGCVLQIAICKTEKERSKPVIFRFRIPTAIPDSEETVRRFLFLFHCSNRNLNDTIIFHFSCSIFNYFDTLRRRPRSERNEGGVVVDRMSVPIILFSNKTIWRKSQREDFSYERHQ